MKLPRTIYVRVEQPADENEEAYLVATETPNGDNGETIGIYQLIKTKKLVIKESLV